MTFQRLQDTDAYILMEFTRTAGHIVKGPVTPSAQQEMKVLGMPFLQRLKANGHDLQTCADLMRAALGLPQRKVGQAQ